MCSQVSVFSVLFTYLIISLASVCLPFMEAQFTSNVHINDLCERGVPVGTHHRPLGSLEWEWRLVVTERVMFALLDGRPLLITC